MLVLTAEVLVGWTLTSVVAGFALGAMIHAAEKVRMDQILEAYCALCAAAEHRC